jgi:hypothetical protein
MRAARCSSPIPFRVVGNEHDGRYGSWVCLANTYEKVRPNVEVTQCAPVLGSVLKAGRNFGIEAGSTDRVVAIARDSSYGSAIAYDVQKESESFLSVR